ncbi:MAG TPA: c-type cytochrome [Terriglobales bacterium]|nr:c-type cytochrome [Terriglobales bacterium]
MIKARHCLGTAGFLWLTLSIVHAADWPVTSADKKSGQVFKNLKVLNNTPSDLLLPSMQFITSSLGVHCDYCHAENAFDKDDKRPKQTARQMMRMMEEINNTQFKNQQKVNCYTCHRGSPKPLSVPVIPSAPARLLNESISDNASVAPGQPSPAVVITKFITALGGTDAIASLNSLEEGGTFHSDAREFPIELYLSKPGRSAARIHFPSADRITVFDGTSGSIAQPGSPPRPMTSGEVDAARMDADLQFPLNINKAFSELKVTGTSKVGPEQVVVLSGERPGLPPVEMYFGITTGLLLRIVHYLPSALGLNPVQTDYSDYRRISVGIKIPFRWTSATPTGRFTVEIRTARPNVLVPERLFSVSAGP